MVLIETTYIVRAENDYRVAYVRIDFYFFDYSHAFVRALSQSTPKRNGLDGAMLFP